MALKFTGKLPEGKDLDRIKKSPQFNGKAFQNLSSTPMKAKDISYWQMIKEFIFNKNKFALPSHKLPSINTDLKKLDQTASITWFGHSSYLLRMDGKNILVDPVLSGHASPFSFMVRAFTGADVYKPGDMPAIDYLLLTHDHYDHLDYKTIQALKGKLSRIYCSLGIRSHLVYWGIEENLITEMDWWDRCQLNDKMELIAAPARHFSGRGFRRNQSLWSSFILKAGGYSIYIGGDSGYDAHFREIGEKFGPFDLAILEAGQYNRMWPLIHMMPEETVQAALDLRARLLLPVHWGKFSLAMHAWNEPIKRLVAKAKEYQLPVVVPMIGQTIPLGSRQQVENWWEED